MHAHARTPPPALLLLSNWITSIARCSYSRTQIGFSVFYGVFSSPWPHQRHQKIALCGEEDLEVTRASLPTRVSFTRAAQVRIHIFLAYICLLHRYLTVPLRTEKQLQFFEKPQRWHDWHDVFAHALLMMKYIIDMFMLVHCDLCWGAGADAAVTRRASPWLMDQHIHDELVSV